MAFENFGKMISNIASTTAKKAGEQMQITKLGLDRAGIERQMEGVYAAMGRYCYNKLKAGEIISEELMEYCRDVDTLAEQLKALDGEIEQHKTERDAAQYDIQIKGSAPASVEYTAESVITPEQQEEPAETEPAETEPAAENETPAE